MPSLTSLPVEIQQKIVRSVIDIDPDEASVCAVVSRTWQALAERETFHTLNLTSDELEAARRIITPTRQSYVRHIILTIQLPYVSKDQEVMHHTQEELFTQVTADLLTTMAGWKNTVTDSIPGGPGVSLQICPFSRPPRKANHNRFWRILDEEFKINDPHSRKRSNDVCRKLPLIPCIKTFEISSCAQERFLSVPFCAELASRMPNLVTVDWALQSVTFSASSATALDQLPQSLRHFTLTYYDSSHPESPSRRTNELNSSNKASWSDPLGSSFRKLSQRLSSMTLNGDFVFCHYLFLPESSLFMQPSSLPNESLQWLRLETLTIRTFVPSPEYLFLSGENHPGTLWTGWKPGTEPVNALCLAAARAASNMPRLTSLEVMCIKQGSCKSCRLWYVVRNRPRTAELSFKSRSTEDMSDEVKDAWRTAAKTHIGPYRELEIRVKGLRERHVGWVIAEVQGYRSLR